MPLPSLSGSVRRSTNSNSASSHNSNNGINIIGSHQRRSANNTNNGSVSSSLTTGTKETEKFAALAEEALKNEAILFGSNGSGPESGSGNAETTKNKKRKSLNADLRVPFVGREKEMEALNSAVGALLEQPKRSNTNNTETAPPKIVCVSGQGGSGKSHLIRQMRSRVLDGDGYFLTGKFSSTNGTAYSGLAMALSELVEQIRNRDFDMGIRRKLEESFPPEDAAILVETFPSLASVLALEEGEEDEIHNNIGSTQNQSGSFSNKNSGKKSNSHSNSNNSSTQRAKQRQFLFLQFIQILLSSQNYVDEDLIHEGDRNSSLIDQHQQLLQEDGIQPDDVQQPSAAALVLVLDDVQWIDPPSLDLVSALVKDQHSRSAPFLLLCTSRPNQKDNADTLFGKEIRQGLHKIPVEHVQLENLSSDNIHAILASFLGVPLICSEEESTADNNTARTTSIGSGDSDNMQELAEIVYEKTNGNAFFVVEFIKALVDQELMAFNYGNLSWKWDARKVKSMVVASNTNDGVVDLLTSKLHNQLTPHQQFALLVATCLGGTFDLLLMERILSRINGMEFLEKRKTNGKSTTTKAREQRWPAATATRDTLEDLVNLGFLNQSSGTTAGSHRLYFFSHDLIRQAVGELMASSISETKTHRLKYRIGECILQGVVMLSGEKKEQSHRSLEGARGGSSELFLGTDLLDQSVGHLNIANGARKGATPTVVTPDQKIQLATYNLLAGETAIRESAFAAGLRYMETGLQLLEEGTKGTEQKQKQHEQLYVKLLSGAAEAHYCTGSLHVMGDYADKVLGRENCSEDVKLKMYLLKCQSTTAQNKFKQCLEFGLVAIRMVGAVRFPSKPNKLHLLREFFKTKRLLRNHTQESLQALPAMDHTEHGKRIATMRIFDWSETSAYLDNKNFVLVGAMISLRWTVKYGISRFSPNALAIYGVILMALFGDVDTATMMGEAAISIAKRIGLPEPKAKVSVLVFPYIHHWTNDIRTCIPPLAYAHKLAMECGNTDITLMSGWYINKIDWGTARIPLAVIAADLKRQCARCSEFKHILLHDGARFLAKELRRLCKDDTEFAWLDDRSDEFSRLDCAGTVDQKDPGIQIFFALARLQVHLLLQENDEALKEAKRIRTKDAAKICLGQTYLPHVQFYRALVFLSCASEGKNVRSNLREVNLILRMMKKWTSKGNANMLHMVCLTEAEVAKVKNQHDKAKELYIEAIQNAIRVGYIHDAGICNERAAVFYLGINQRPRAAHHIQQAVKCFSDWGAGAVVDRILETYGDLTPLFTSVTATLHRKQFVDSLPN